MFSLSNAVSGSSSTMRIRLTTCFRLPNSIDTPSHDYAPATNEPQSSAAESQRSAHVPRPPQADKGGPQRIAKLLARAGIASRREIERMIAEGRIALNGEKLTTPATLLDSVDGLTVDGRPVRPAKATRLYRFYKPPAP